MNCFVRNKLKKKIVQYSFNIIHMVAFVANWAASACVTNGTDVGISERDETTRAVLHKLRHPYYYLVEAQQRGRAGVQRLRSILQIARGQQAACHAEGRHTDEEKETEEDSGTECQIIHRRPRNHRLDHILSFHRFVNTTLCSTAEKDNEI